MGLFRPCTSLWDAISSAGLIQLSGVLGQPFHLLSQRILLVCMGCCVICQGSVSNLFESAKASKT